MKDELTLGSLFSGIGGMDLGFERAGFKTIWQCEISPFCREVLSEHFPQSVKYEDVTTIAGCHPTKPLVIAGGFPCQDISLAQNTFKRKGIDGARSGLWKNFAELLCFLRPRYALIENSPNLVNLGLERILSDLAGLRYDAEWFMLSASAFGFPHQRKRIFIVAYAQGFRRICAPLFQRSDFENIAKRKNNNSRLQVGLEDDLHFEIAGRKFPLFLGHLRNDDGLSEKLDKDAKAALSEIIRGYGNAVVTDVAEFLANGIKRDFKRNQQ